MRVIRVHEFGGPEVMRLEEIPDLKPGPGQVLVRVRAAGVNPVDTYIRSGAYAQKPPLPYTPGFDAGGTVGAVGSGVTGMTPGDRVYTVRTLTGAYAELVLCDISQVKPLPENVSFAQGAALCVPYGTAYRSLFQRAHAVPGETVLIHGASGGVGIAGVQLARAHGMTVIGTAGSERGRTLVKEHGARHVLDHTAPDYLQKLMALTEGRGADVILEMLANVNLQKDLDVVARFGRIIVIGNRGAIEINARGTMTKDAAILGLALPNATPEEIASIHAALVAGLANGTLKPVVGQELALTDAARAHEAVLAPGAYGKIVLIP